MAPSTTLLATLMAITFYITSSELVNCNGDCSCNPGKQSTEECTLNCATPDGCRASTLTCGAGRPCTIMCIDSSSCADYAYINAMAATDVFVACNGNDACKSHLTLLCGSGDCRLQCGAGTSCEEFGSVDATRSNSFTCGNCPPSIAELQFTPDPSPSPTDSPSPAPTNIPTTSPTKDPTPDPTKSPTNDPTTSPTNDPTNDPTSVPTYIPTFLPTFDPTAHPTTYPTTYPTHHPTNDPTSDPTNDPTKAPTLDPTNFPTDVPTDDPTHPPTVQPSNHPSVNPTHSPSVGPTMSTVSPTDSPTVQPTADPSHDPTSDPTHGPTKEPTTMPTSNPTDAPTETIGYALTTQKDVSSQDLSIVMICIALLIVVIGGICWYRKKKLAMTTVMDKFEDGMAKFGEVVHVQRADVRRADVRRADVRQLRQPPQNDGLVQIVQEGPAHVASDGDGDGGTDTGYLLRVHYNGKKFKFALKGSNSGETDDCGWSDNTYDQITSQIREQFKMENDNFGLREIVDDCPVDIDDMDDIAASFDCCVYDTKRRSIDLFVKTENDLFNMTNSMLDGEELTDSEDGLITARRCR